MLMKWQKVGQWLCIAHLKSSNRTLQTAKFADIIANLFLVLQHSCCSVAQVHLLDFLLVKISSRCLKKQNGDHKLLVEVERTIPVSAYSSCIRGYNDWGCRQGLPTTITNLGYTIDNFHQLLQYWESFFKQFKNNLWGINILWCTFRTKISLLFNLSGHIKKLFVWLFQSNKSTWL